MRTLLGFLWVAGCLSASARTWTSVSGKTVEAEFVAQQGMAVILQTTGGQRLSISMQALSREDQEFIKSQQSGAAETPSEPLMAAPAAPAAEAKPADVDKPAAEEKPVAEANPTTEAKPVAEAPSVGAPGAQLLAPPGAAKPVMPTLSRPGSHKAPAAETLTEDQIKGLLREAVIDEKTGEKVEFNGGITAKNRLGKDEKAWKDGQPIPYKITCELVRVRKKKSGEEDRRGMSGTVHFYMVDEAGAVLFTKSMPVDRMEPKGEGGFKGEVAKPGKYSVVMFTEYKDTQFGLKETANITIPK